MIIKRLTDLPLQHQQTLLETYRQYPVVTDVSNARRVITFMGETVDYDSIVQTRILHG